MLERARATALALLGATAAVGLAIVALAANQGWPLVAGSSIPPLPKEHVGRASVVARAPGPSPARPGAARRSTGTAAHARAGAAAPPAPVDAPSGSEEATALVVSGQAPARSPGGASPKAPSSHGKTRTGASHPKHPPTSRSPAAPTSSPPAQAPEGAPGPAPAPAQPEAVVSEAPEEESSVPSWSQGKGHAYGRSEEPHGQDRGD